MFVEFFVCTCIFGGIKIATTDNVRISSVEVERDGDCVKVAEGEVLKWLGLTNLPSHLKPESLYPIKLCAIEKSVCIPS